MIELEHLAFGFEQTVIDYRTLNLLNYSSNRLQFFRTSNKLERIHRLVIEPEHPILGFERSNIVRPITRNEKYE